jgi:signal transduction histidine kinase
VILLALTGWSVAALLAGHVAGVRSALDAVGDAEHELRGALTAIELSLDPVLAGALDSELARARTALTDLAAARAGTVVAPRRWERVALEPLARSAATAWQAAARRRGRRVQVDWRAGPVRVLADRGRLAQALGNLLANAVEHGAGPVRLEARRRGGAVRLEVTNRLTADRGRGLRIAARAVEGGGGRLTLGSSPAHAAAAIELPLAG